MRAARRKNSRSIIKFPRRLPASASSFLQTRRCILDRATITKTRQDPSGERMSLSKRPAEGNLLRRGGGEDCELERDGRLKKDVSLNERAV